MSWLTTISTSKIRVTHLYLAKCQIQRTKKGKTIPIKVVTRNAPYSNNHLIIMEPIGKASTVLIKSICCKTARLSLKTPSIISTTIVLRLMNMSWNQLKRGRRKLKKKFDWRHMQILRQILMMGGITIRCL